LQKTIRNRISALQKETDSDTKHIADVLGPSSLHSQVDNLLAPGDEKSSKHAQTASAAAANDHRLAKSQQSLVQELSTRVADADLQAKEKRGKYKMARDTFKSSTQNATATAQKELDKTEATIMTAASAEEAAQDTSNRASDDLEAATIKDNQAAAKLKLAKSTLKNDKEVHTKKQEGMRAVRQKYDADFAQVKELEAKANAAEKHAQSAKKSLQKQQKEATDDVKAEEAKVKQARRSSSEFRAQAKAKAKEAGTKQLQRAKLTMYRTATEVADRKATALETESTEDLGEKAANNLSQARATARLNAKRAEHASLKLSGMETQAGLDQLQASMKKLEHTRDLSVGESAENDKLNDWYQKHSHIKQLKIQANEATKQSDAEMAEIVDVGTKSENSANSDDQEDDLGESGLTTPVSSTRAASATMHGRGLDSEGALKRSAFEILSENEPY